MEYEVLEIGGHEHLLGIVDDKILAAVASVAKPGGSLAFASLPNPSADVLGYVRNVTDAFVTDSRFVEGDGKSYPAGTNVWCVDTGTEQAHSYKYDIFASFIDLSPYQLKSDLGGLTEAEMAEIIAEL